MLDRRQVYIRLEIEIELDFFDQSKFIKLEIGFLSSDWLNSI